MKSTNQKNKKLFFFISSLLIVGVTLFSSGIIASCSRTNDSKRLDSDSIKNNITKNFANINLDNYKDYFIGANNKPDKENTGRMTKSIFAKMANLHENDIDTFSITKVEEREEDNGYVRLNVNLTINKKSKNIRLDDNLDNNNVEAIEFECLTGMYDPNTEYNKKFINIVNGNSFIYFNEEQKDNYNQKIFYIPYKVERIGSGSFCFLEDMIPKSLEVIDFRFSNLSSAQKAHSMWRYCPIKELNFANTKIDLYLDNVSNFFREMKNLEKIDFSNIPITGIPQNMFLEDSNLKTLKLDGCEKLTIIENNAFKNCSSLQSLDFSDSPIYKVDNSAFEGCTNLKTIYVKDEIARAAFQQSIDGAGLSTKIIIKNN